MKRLVVVLLTLSLFVPAAFARVTGAVALVSPGEWLTAGSEATLEWNASLGDEVEEWEAFFSFDGGSYYAIRVTPHLDAKIRSFRFRVPPVPCSDARLLIRYGDEQRETEVELPTRFHIVATSRLTLLRAAVATASPSRGEAARNGDRPVAVWVEGTRAGEALRVFSHSTPSGVAPAAPAAELRAAERDGELLETPPSPESDLTLTPNGIVVERRTPVAFVSSESPLHPLTLSRRLRI